MAATNVPLNSSLNLGLPSTVPDAITDPQAKQVAEMLITALNNMLRGFEQYVGATQKDISQWTQLLPTDTLLRHQLGRLYVPVSENLVFGNLINLFNNAGVLNARKSNATAGTIRPAHGFCSTSAGILVGATGEIILSQGLAAISGVLPGDKLYLSTTAGLASLTPAVGAGQLEQFVGIGVANNVAYLDITMGQYIQH